MILIRTIVIKMTEQYFGTMLLIVWRSFESKKYTKLH